VLFAVLIALELARSPAKVINREKAVELETVKALQLPSLRLLYTNVQLNSQGGRSSSL